MILSKVPPWYDFTNFKTELRKVVLRWFTSVPDPDLEIRGLGVGGAVIQALRQGWGWSPKTIFRPFGPQFGLKIRGGGSPGSATVLDTIKLVRYLGPLIWSTLAAKVKGKQDFVYENLIRKTKSSYTCLCKWNDHAKIASKAVTLRISCILENVYTLLYLITWGFMHILTSSFSCY